jgi:hypothetical protein
MINDSNKNTSNNLTLLIDLQYLPSISYFKQIKKADTIILESHETFQKQTFRNRCEILTANGRDALIVPVKHGSSSMIKDIQIDYQQRWYQIHERTVRAAYGKAPFFDFLIDDLASIWAKKHAFLWDLNIEMLSLCLEKLTLKKEILESNSYIKPLETGDNHLDLRGKIIPSLNQKDGHDVNKTYHQVFGNEFVKELSIIDVLFCAVLDSPEIVH